MRFTATKPNETITERRENQLDILDRMIDQGKSLEEILQNTRIDTDTVINRYYDLLAASMDIFG